jgi:hypothetical protein
MEGPVDAMENNEEVRIQAIKCLLDHSSGTY